MAQGTPDALSVERLPDDTAKVLQLSDLCFAYRRQDPDSAILFGHRALVLAQRLRFAKGEAQALNDLAIIHLDRSDYAKADTALHAALRIRQELGDREGMGALYNKLGILYQSQFRFEEALEENRQALLLFQGLGQRAKEAVILSNMAILEFNLRQYDEALRLHGTAAEVRSAIGDSSGLAATKGNMGNVLLAMGDTMRALQLLAESGSYFQRNDLELEYAVQAHNEAGVRLALGELLRARNLYSIALQLREKAGDRKAIASSLTGSAAADLAMGSTQEALRAARRAIRLATDVGATSEVMEADKLLARIHAHLGNADSTLIFHERYSALRDSVFSSDMGKRLADLQVRIGMERKEHELQQQRVEIAELGRKAERRNFLLALAIGGIGAIALVAMLLFQRQRRKAHAARDAAVIAERELGLKAMVESTDAERQRIAAELHDGVGQQLAGLKYRLESLSTRADLGGEGVLDDLLVIADDAGRDVRGIAHSMMPRALGQLGLVPALEDMLCRSFSVPGMNYAFESFGLADRLPREVEVGVFRISQEAVANILKHAQASEVNVQLLRNNDQLVLIIEDNGRGYRPEEGRSGIGLQSMMDRARVLHGVFHLEPGAKSGTIATLRVPLPN